MKTCLKCNTAKQLSEFSKNTTKRDGLQGECKACAAINYALYRSANKDKLAAAAAAWQKANPDKCRVRNSKWKAANKDKVKAASAAYHVVNRDKRNAAACAWAKANPGKARVASAVWAKANPEAIRTHAHNRRARKRDAEGRLSKGLSERLFKLQRGKCACCHADLTKVKQHMDHKMPLALGGANEDWNIQLLCQPCNNQKSAKHPIDFMQQRGFLL